MAKAKTKSRSRIEPDSAFLLKIVLYLIVGTQWIRVVNPSLTREMPIPIGLIIGLAFAMHDQFKIDRKIEYVVLLIAMLVGFWSQVGIYATILK